MATESLHKFVSQSSEEDSFAYRANHEVFKGGMSKTEVVEYYNKWGESGDYDSHLNSERYNGPVCAAAAMGLFFTPDKRPTVNILDVAAGTGRVGEEMHNLGFRLIDALDPSQGMLNKAKEKGVYTNFICSFVDEERSVPVEDDAYDGLCVCGGMGAGHIPSHAILEMIRLVKPGGVVCITMREEYLHHVDNYKDALVPLMEELEQQGKWSKYHVEIIQNYAFGKDGVVFQYVVL